MKIGREKTLFKSLSPDLEEHVDCSLSEIRRAIAEVDWPEGSGNFTVYPEKNANGVKPIKAKCMSYLQKCGWVLEERMKITGENRPGPIDAVKPISNQRYIALEWETGNISSSHRAVNKMAVGLLKGMLIGGILILPSRKLYNFLTDRIGNFQELEPYFIVWEHLTIDQGFLAIIEIEHDEVSEAVPKIPKGTDGWAKHQKRG